MRPARFELATPRFVVWCEQQPATASNTKQRVIAGRYTTAVVVGSRGESWVVVPNCPTSGPRRRGCQGDAVPRIHAASHSRPVLTRGRASPKDKLPGSRHGHRGDGLSGAVFPAAYCVSNSEPAAQSNVVAAVRLNPPLTDDEDPLAVFPVPPLTDEFTALASLPAPPLTEE